jgi:hypothetical protein
VTFLIREYIEISFTSWNVWCWRFSINGHEAGWQSLMNRNCGHWGKGKHNNSTNINIRSTRHLQLQRKSFLKTSYSDDWKILPKDQMVHHHDDTSLIRYFMARYYTSILKPSCFKISSECTQELNLRSYLMARSEIPSCHLFERYVWG